MLEAERLATVQRALAFANMSVQGKLIEALRQQCEGWATRMGTGNFKKQTTDSGKAGLF